jgi:hypothetical protein
MVDVMSDSRHCGLCDNACVGMRPCVEGSCMLASSSDGALTVTMEGNEPELYWSHYGAGGPLELVNRDTGLTDSMPGTYLLWDLQVVNGYLGLLPLIDASVLPVVTGAPQWFTWGNAPVDVCPAACVGYDVAGQGEILAFSTDSDIFVKTETGVLDLSGPGTLPATTLAASTASPNPVAIGRNDGTLFDGLRYAPMLDMLPFQDLPEVVARVPNAITFMGKDLYWISMGDVRCRRDSDGQILTFLQWKRPGEPDLRQPTALWVARPSAPDEQPLMYVAYTNGSILRRPATCGAQTTVEVLIEPPLEVGAAVYAITGPIDPDGPIYYAMFSADNATYGGVFARHRMARVLRTD